MIPKYAKVSEIADRFRVSADAVYLWIRQGKIPADCVARVAGTVRVDEDQFERRLRSGALCQRRGRKRSPGIGSPGTQSAGFVGEDSITTLGAGPRTEHRWTSHGGHVEAEHPFSPEMVEATE